MTSNRTYRLDMQINGKEYFVADAPATTDGYESILRGLTRTLPALFGERVAASVAGFGDAELTSVEMAEPETLIWIADYTDVDDVKEVVWCMCLWEGDEHLQSLMPKPVAEVEA